MQGKIIKGIAGFYYVYIEEVGAIYECKAKGVFRNKKIKPLVGDNCLVDIVDNDNLKGNITEILERKNSLIRPAFANIDQAMVIFAVKQPDINYNLLDRFLVYMDYQDVDTVVVFNKVDLATKEEIDALESIYNKCGCRLIWVSTYDKTGVDEVLECLKGKTTVLAGPSGVGKSSLTNLILPEEVNATGEVSKIGRGRHTTRHSEIFNVSPNTYIADTPGFTSLNPPDIEKEELRFYFEEFKEHEGNCRFNGCVHVNEPDCSVKKALADGQISKRRYQSYIEIFDELKNKKKY
ncbi:ribosome small subunit-dependent GTPase A [Lachnospira multipara]|uniref:ribosome small subunit-dependent GTPase A n=1 Tax=Lachnospira multipara TaxID=28051 RepID=UPI000407643D|nr:ribosome small subunit-dependent GTPase A [Lachnospira multipara]